MSAYVELAPPASLAGQVACAWSSHDGSVRVLPDACTDIVFDAGRLMVVGPATAAAVVPASPGQRRFGVRFRVGSAATGVGVPVDDLRDDAVPLAELWGRAGRRLEERVAEAEFEDGDGLAALVAGLARRARDAHEPDVLARQAALAVAGGVSLRETCRRIGLGERHLRRRFDRAVGYGPATLVRIVRFQRFVDLADRYPHASVGRLAADAGYADQAHLSRECGRLSGLTPAVLLAQRPAAAGDKSVLFKHGRPGETTLEGYRPH